MTTVRDAAPRAHPSVETAFLPPEAVLWDGRHAEVHHLNPSASAVWLLIDGELTRDQIAEELSELFEVSYDVMRPDVDAAIDEFVRKGLLAAAGTEAVLEHAHDEHRPHHHRHRHDPHRELRHHLGTHDPVEAPATDAAIDSVIPLQRPPDP